MVKGLNLIILALGSYRGFIICKRIKGKTEPSFQLLHKKKSLKLKATTMIHTNTDNLSSTLNQALTISTINLEEKKTSRHLIANTASPLPDKKNMPRHLMENTASPLPDKKNMPKHRRANTASPLLYHSRAILTHLQKRQVIN